MKHYIQWQPVGKGLPEEYAATITKHWQMRFELGSAVVLADDPKTISRLITKHWRKITRQAQAARSSKTDAGDILELTKTISRMQRVTFTTKSPDIDPDASFYIIDPTVFKTLPLHCFTVYYTTPFTQEAPVLQSLPEHALVVAFQAKKLTTAFLPKSELEEYVRVEEDILVRWLQEHEIYIESLVSDIDKANDALDLLLGSTSLQAEFNVKTKHYIQTVQLAQPMRLNNVQQQRIAALERLMQHVRALSPAFLSDHIVDSNTEDSFLLRDPATAKALTLDSYRQQIMLQRKAGRHHLVTALEQKAGFKALAAQ